MADNRVVTWNTDKPHRCPACNAIMDDGHETSAWKVYACCKCGTLFAKRPWLAWFLPVGICADIEVGVCPHREPDGSAEGGNHG